jgi:hypothetical protein
MIVRAEVRMACSRCWVLVLVAAACHKADSGMQIGSTGGVVTATNGTSLSIPSGALGAPTPITIDVSDEIVPGAVGSVYKFGPEGQTFAVPITVTLDFGPDRLPTGKTAADVVVLTAPAGSSDFTSLGGQLSDATHVQATTTHFSIFGAAIAMSTSSDGGEGDMSVVNGSCVSIGQACGSGGLACCGGGSCANAVCAPPPNCGNGQTSCNGSCVITTSDPSNCGGCGNHCMSPTPVCINGVCSPPAA